jgi:diketogulonate reductase-like aldo/keto reductase
MLMPDIKLNNGHTIPQVGLGLWQVKDDKSFDEIFHAAWQAGYRHFDTAQIYGNEQALGNTWTKAGIKREELFITTKISVTHFGKTLTKRSFETSLQKLQTKYVDLLLLHFPVTVLRKSSWLEIEKYVVDGRAKSIGVSNYTVKHLEQLKEYASITPAVNQVELHVFLQQPELREYCKQNGIVIEAYSPIAHGKDMSDRVVKEIAIKHGKSYAQIMLKWLLQQDLVILPKSVTPDRIKQNIDLFDFSLDTQDMTKLSKLDKKLRTCWDPTHIP